MVSSHETADDYLHFFKSLNTIVRRLVPKTNISFDFKPSHIVTDAAKAIAKAIKRIYPSCVLIMCWFHFKYNLRMHKSLLPNKTYLIVCKQINKLHECTCAGTYALLLRKTLKSWDQYPRFKRYFTRQWINSSFNNWQVFKKTAGLAATNGSEENYNNKFKNLFTDKLRYHMIPALEKFEIAIEFESADKREFITDISKVKPNAKVKQEANKLLKDKTLIEIDENIFDYNHHDGSTSRINVSKGTCDCSEYYDKVICKHLVAARLFS